MITLDRIDEINSTLSTREAKASHVLCFDGAEARALISLARWAIEAKVALEKMPKDHANCTEENYEHVKGEALSTFPSKDGEAP